MAVFAPGDTCVLKTVGTATNTYAMGQVVGAEKGAGVDQRDVRDFSTGVVATHNVVDLLTLDQARVELA